mgnify:FL=1
MKTIGFVISHKRNEKRRALLPTDLPKIKNLDYLFFEEGYGNIIGYNDEDYKQFNVNIVKREEAFHKDIVCCPKAPENKEMEFFLKNQIFFGWIHAVLGRDITDFLINNNMTGIAWENMFDKNLHVFFKNNELAGEAAVKHATLFYGRTLHNLNVAILGRGNCARGALKELYRQGANCFVYDKRTIKTFRDYLNYFDIIVNATLWDVFSKDKIIFKEDLKKMKKGSMIIDISCNNQMEIETSIPTTIDNPIYIVDGVMHYAVDHTPTLFWKEASESISNEVSKYIDLLIEEDYNDVIKNAICILNGKIIDENIKKFQNRF